MGFHEASELFFEVNDSVINAGTAGGFLLAVVAEKSIARLVMASLWLDSLEIHHAFHEIAEICLSMEVRPGAAVQHRVQGHAIGLCIGFQDRLALRGHLDLDPLGFA